MGLLTYVLFFNYNVNNEAYTTLSYAYLPMPDRF